MKTLFTILFSLSTLFTFSQTWQQTNGPYGGDVRCLAQNSSGELFAGTRGGGILRSSDNGDTWVQVNNGLTAKDVWALIVNQDDVVFAGTSGGGIFRSEKSLSFIAAS